MTRTYDITLAVFLYLAAATKTSSAHEWEIVQNGLACGMNHSLYLQASPDVAFLPKTGKLSGRTRYNYRFQKTEEEKIVYVANNTSSDTINSMQYCCRICIQV